MLRTKLPKSLLSLIILPVLLIQLNIARSEDDRPDAGMPRYGLATISGATFDPVDDIYFLQVSGFVMWDYDTVWRHWAPDPLRFKVEGAAGVTIAPQIRAMASVGMMALYYLEFLSSPRLNPYIEGGIGVIYTDFQVEGQGSRFNFNPQIGVGTEFNVDSGPPFFGALRLSHISNAGLSDDNRGVNSIVFMVGRFF